MGFRSFFGQCAVLRAVTALPCCEIFYTMKADHGQQYFVERFAVKIVIISIVSIYFAASEKLILSQFSLVQKLYPRRGFYWSERTILTVV